MARPSGPVIAACLALALAAPVQSAPSDQLALSVASRLAFYHIRVAPDSLTTAQAAALHLLLVSNRDGYLDTRRKARAILRDPDFRD